MTLELVWIDRWNMIKVALAIFPFVVGVNLVLEATAAMIEDASLNTTDLFTSSIAVMFGWGVGISVFFAFNNKWLKEADPSELKAKEGD